MARPTHAVALERRARIVEMRRAGEKMEYIAAVEGIAVMNVWRHLKAAGFAPARSKNLSGNLSGIPPAPAIEPSLAGIRLEIAGGGDDVAHGLPRSLERLDHGVGSLADAPEPRDHRTQIMAGASNGDR